MFANEKCTADCVCICVCVGTALLKADYQYLARIRQITRRAFHKHERCILITNKWEREREREEKKTYQHTFYPANKHANWTRKMYTQIWAMHIRMHSDVYGQHWSPHKLALICKTRRRDDAHNDNQYFALNIDGIFSRIAYTYFTQQQQRKRCTTNWQFFFGLTLDSCKNSIFIKIRSVNSISDDRVNQSFSCPSPAFTSVRIHNIVYTGIP